MRNIKNYNIVPLIIIISNLSSFLLFLFADPPYNFTFVEKNASPVRWILLSIGLILLLITTISFYSKYRQNPSETRKIVLLGLVFLSAAIAVFTFSSILRPQDRILKHYIRSYSNYFLLIGIMYLLNFGTNVLLSAHEESKGMKRFKIAFSSLVLFNFAFYLVSMLVRIPLHQEDENLFTEISNYFLYLLTALSVALLLLMAIKSYRISKKERDKEYQRGLLSLSLSFILLASSILILGIQEILDISNDLMQDLMPIVVISISIVSFYTIYLGFVKPGK